MLTYAYKCCSCQEYFPVYTIGTAVFVNNDYEHDVEELENVSCPKCGSNDVVCDYDPSFDPEVW